MLQGIVDGKEAREEAGLLVDFGPGPEVHAAKAVLEGPGQRPFFHDLELDGIVDEDVFGKEVEQLAVGGVMKGRPLHLFSLRPGNRSPNLVMVEVVFDERRRRDVEAVLELRRRAGPQCEPMVPRVERAPPEAHLLVALAQSDRIDDLARPEVRDLDVLEVASCKRRSAGGRR